MMRIRLPFAGVFLLLFSLAAYAGLTTLQLGQHVNDKVLHTVTFFLLTVVFYWIVDTNRRRNLNMTLVVCTLGLGVGSEFVQSFLPNDRDFDIYDIVANAVGSLVGVSLCSWYHRRMLERRRQLKTYNAVPGEDGADVELGQDHETEIMDGQSQPRSLEEEVDKWDENAANEWDRNGAADASTPAIGKSKDPDAPDSGDSKRRAD